MTIRHIMTHKGWLTEANYTRWGKHLCARLPGLLDAHEMKAEIERLRRLAS